MAPKRHPRSSKASKKKGSKNGPQKIRFFDQFWSHFGGHFGAKNGSKRGPKMGPILGSILMGRRNMLLRAFALMFPKPYFLQYKTTLSLRTNEVQEKRFCKLNRSGEIPIATGIIFPKKKGRDKGLLEAILKHLGAILGKRAFKRAPAGLPVKRFRQDEGLMFPKPCFLQ